MTTLQHLFHSADQQLVGCTHIFFKHTSSIRYTHTTSLSPVLSSSVITFFSLLFTLPLDGLLYSSQDRDYGEHADINQPSQTPFLSHTHPQPSLRMLGQKRMLPAVGVEPTACYFPGSCSTAELHRQTPSPALTFPRPETRLVPSPAARSAIQLIGPLEHGAVSERRSEYGGVAQMVSRG